MVSNTPPRKTRFRQKITFCLNVCIHYIMFHTSMLYLKMTGYSESFGVLNGENIMVCFNQAVTHRPSATLEHGAWITQKKSSHITFINSSYIENLLGFQFCEQKRNQTARVVIIWLHRPICLFILVKSVWVCFLYGRAFYIYINPCALYWQAKLWMITDRMFDNGRIFIFTVNGL